MPAVAQRSQVRLRPLDGSDSDALVFPLKPDRIEPVTDSVYVPVPIAGADWAPGYSGPLPVAWARNNPSRIALEALLVDDKTLGIQGGSDDIEKHIDKLERFQRKDAKTKEPPDLVLTVGTRSDRVRLERLTIQPKLWTDDLRRQQARISLQLLVVRPRG